MTAASAGKVVSLLLVSLNAALVLLLPGVAARATGPDPSSSYQPTSGLDERWVTEDDFPNAPPFALKGEPDPRRSCDGGQTHVEEPSWWDDDGDDDDERTSPSASPHASVRTQVGEKPPWPRRRRWRARKGAKAAKAERERPPPAIAREGEGAAPADAKGSLSAAASEYDEEHPLRTDEWRLDVRLSRLGLSREEGGWYFPERRDDATSDGGRRVGSGGGSRRKRQVMQFARNGYVKVLEERGAAAAAATSSSGKRPRRSLVGKWRVGHSGVAFDIPVQVHVKRRNDDDRNPPPPRMTVLHYHADLHLNKFGERPRMFRGVITRDRHASFLPPGFLRPVVGSFRAEGIGRDTADTRYRARPTSLSRQQALEDARRGAQQP